MKIYNLLTKMESKKPIPVFSVDIFEKLLIIASTNGDVDLYKDEVLYKSVKKHSGAVLCVRFNIQGSMVASCGDDGTVIIYDLDLNVLNYFKNHTGDVTNVLWTDKFLISVGHDGYIIFYDLLHFKLFSKIKAHEKKITGVSCNKKNDFICTQGEDGLVLLKGTTIYKRIPPFDGTILESFFSRMSWSPDGQIFSCGLSFNQKVNSIEIYDMEMESRYSLLGHVAPCEVTCFNPNMFTDNTKQYFILAAGSQDLSISLWTTLSPYPFLLIKSVSEMPILDLMWSQDGSTLYFCSYDGSVGKMEFDMKELGVLSTKECFVGNSDLFLTLLNGELFDKKVSTILAMKDISPVKRRKKKISEETNSTTNISSANISDIVTNISTTNNDLIKNKVELDFSNTQQLPKMKNTAEDTNKMKKILSNELGPVKKEVNFDKLQQDGTKIGNRIINPEDRTLYKDGPTSPKQSYSPKHLKNFKDNHSINTLDKIKKIRNNCFSGEMSTDSNFSGEFNHNIEIHGEPRNGLSLLDVLSQEAAEEKNNFNKRIPSEGQRLRESLNKIDIQSKGDPKMRPMLSESQMMRQYCGDPQMMRNNIDPQMMRQYGVDPQMRNINRNMVNGNPNMINPNKMIDKNKMNNDKSKMSDKILIHGNSNTVITNVGNQNMINTNLGNQNMVNVNHSRSIQPPTENSKLHENQKLHENSKLHENQKLLENQNLESQNENIGLRISDVTDPRLISKNPTPVTKVIKRKVVKPISMDDIKEAPKEIEMFNFKQAIKIENGVIKEFYKDFGDYSVELNTEKTILSIKRSKKDFFEIHGNFKFICASKKYVAVYTSNIEIYDLKKGTLVCPFIGTSSALYMDIYKENLLFLEGDGTVIIFNIKNNTIINTRIPRYETVIKIKFSKLYFVVVEYKDSSYILDKNTKLWYLLRKDWNDIKTEKTDFENTVDETLTKLENKFLVNLMNKRHSKLKKVARKIVKMLMNMKMTDKIENMLKRIFIEMIKLGHKKFIIKCLEKLSRNFNLQYFIVDVMKSM